MTADAEVQYDTMSVKTLRGTEKNSITKWESQGWEFVTQNTGTLRSELLFRRPKEKTSWKPFAILGGALAVLGIFITIMVIATGGDEGKQPESKPAVPVASSAPPAKPSKIPPPSASPRPSEAAVTPPAAQGPLTIENNADLAALLTGPADIPTIEAFAQKYAGQLIEFDGSIGAMNHHGSYNTRYDILIAYGDYSETHSNGGPSFQFRDVNITNDLKLTGNVPDTIGVGTNVHIIARVGSFKDPLFQLEPVSTRVR